MAAVKEGPEDDLLALTPAQLALLPASQRRTFRSRLVPGRMHRSGGVRAARSPPHEPDFAIVEKDAEKGEELEAFAAGPPPVVRRRSVPQKMRAITHSPRRAGQRGRPAAAAPDTLPLVPARPILHTFDVASAIPPPEPEVATPSDSVSDAGSEGGAVSSDSASAPSTPASAADAAADAAAAMPSCSLDSLDSISEPEEAEPVPAATALADTARLFSDVGSEEGGADSSDSASGPTAGGPARPADALAHAPPLLPACLPPTGYVVDAGFSLSRCEPGSSAGPSWSEMDASAFRVRCGPNYRYKGACSMHRNKETKP